MLFGNEYHIALHGHPVRPDGTFKPLIELNMHIPDTQEWRCVYSNKFISANSVARVVKVEFKQPNSTRTEWIQLTIPIKVTASGVVEDSGKHFGTAMKALFKSKGDKK